MKVGRKRLAEDIERVKAMRAHLGEGFPLMVDANMTWSVDEAIRAARAVAVHNGRIVKRTGDGVLIEFRSVVDAVRCAIEMQNGMIERNAGLPPERRIEFRVGIHLGDVVEESDGDLMGDSVNIAARLEGIADPGGICLSEDAYRQVRDRLKEGFADLGEKELKNIARPVRVFAIKTASSGVTQELIASTPELGGDPEQEYFGGRQARRCAARGA
jgi:adenylate cyclase